MNEKQRARNDARFGAIKPLIESKRIKSFDQIFWYVPKTNVAVRLGVKGERFNLMILDPGLLRVDQVKKLASVFKVKVLTMMMIVLAEPSKLRKKVNKTLVGARIKNKKRISPKKGRNKT